MICRDLKIDLALALIMEMLAKHLCQVQIIFFLSYVLLCPLTLNTVCEAGATACIQEYYCMLALHSILNSVVEGLM